MSKSKVASFWPIATRLIAALRKPTLALATVAGAALILYFVNHHYPIGDWLFWRIAWVWLWALLFGASSLSLGHTLLSRLLTRSLPVGEHLVQSMALGVLGFFLLTFVGGLLGLFGHVFGVALPLLLLAATGYPLLKYLRRVLKHVRGFAARYPRRQSWPLLLSYGAGLISLVAIYLTILTPRNPSFDSLWYHLPLAEAYVARGAIRPFVEGWFPASGPHLASILYAWGFQLPWLDVVYRIEMAAHIEFVLFLATLASIPVLTRRLLGGKSMRHAWVVTFLFPGIFLYDSSLCVGADHVAAFFAVPIWLALLRYWRRPSPHAAVVLGASISGALLSKYTASILAVFPIAVATGRSLWLLARAPFRKEPVAELSARRVGAALGTFALTGLIVTTPNWLKNLLWYGDPIYPVLNAHFHDHPWNPDVAKAYEQIMLEGRWQPTGTTSHKWWETFKVIFTYAFKPHDWPPFHRNVPVFGFLFTISTAMILFLRKTARTWGLIFGVWTAIVVWFWIHHQDRYLQAALPWMVAVTAAVLWKTWHEGKLARSAVILLLATQVIWGGDTYFFRTHAIVHESPLKWTINFIASGYEKKYDRRNQGYGKWYKLGEKLPRDAKPLLHETQMRYGINHVTVDDWPGLQGAISYDRYQNIAQLHADMLRWGVTHVVWHPSKSKAMDSLGGDLLFFDYALNVTTNRRSIIGLYVAEVPQRTPQAPKSDIVAYFGCGRTYAPGLYHRITMNVLDRGTNRHYPKPFAPLDSKHDLTAEEMIARARYIVSSTKCKSHAYPTSFPSDFTLAARRKKLSLWIRTSASNSQQAPPPTKTFLPPRTPVPLRRMPHLRH